MSNFEQARQHMVDGQLRTEGVTDWRILTIMGETPRENFVPEGREALAYADIDHKFTTAGLGRFLPAPVPFARLAQLAAIRPNDTVLDISAVTGYSTAVLAGLAASVTGLEPDPDLAAKAKANLTTLGITNAKIVNAPLAQGIAGTFDVIVVEGAVRVVQSAWLDLLAEGGRLVVLEQDDGPAVAHIYVRSGHDVAGRAEFNASMPRLALEQPEATFVF